MVDVTYAVADISVKTLCRRGHPNKPENARCFICGEFLMSGSGLLPRHTRPPAPPLPVVRRSPVPPPPPLPPPSPRHLWNVTPPATPREPERDPLALVIRRPSPPDGTFLDADSGEEFSYGNRKRYHSSSAYQKRRSRILAGRACDQCGGVGKVLWAERWEHIGRETPDTTIVLCDDCNDKAFRGQEPRISES